MKDWAMRPMAATVTDASGAVSTLKTHANAWYDGAGNLRQEVRSDGFHGYTYNGAGRLGGAWKGGVRQTQYFYNALGQMVNQSRYEGGVVTRRTHAVHDLEGNRIADYEVGVGLLREYVWLDGKPLAVIEGGRTFHVRWDQIGRPVLATEVIGGVVYEAWTAEYLPFGGVHVATGPVPALRFPGQWFQAESGLHQNWHRDYDPTTGRYLQPDPLGLIDGASVYGYARQSPLRYADPEGRNSVAGGALIGGGIGGPAGALAGAAIGGAITLGGYLLYDWFTGDEACNVLPNVIPAPTNLPAFPDFKPAKPKTQVQGGGGLRKRWKDPKGKIAEWDSKKGEVEIYDKTGKKHKGAFDPNTGKQTGPAKPDRKVDP